MRIFLQHIGGKHQEARRAIAALQAVIFDEGALQRVQFVAVGETFDGTDFLPCACTANIRQDVPPRRRR